MVHFLLSGNLAHLEGQADVLANHILKALQLLLGTEKGSNHHVFEKCLASGLEFADLGLGELHARGLLLMQLFTSLMNALILELRSVVVEKLFNFTLKGLEVIIFHDAFAEIAGFINDCGTFSDGGHDLCLP